MIKRIEIDLETRNVDGKTEQKLRDFLTKLGFKLTGGYGGLDGTKGFCYEKKKKE